MSVNHYGGRLGRILEVYPRVSCPVCQSPQVQIVSYLSGDPSWKCRKGGCRQTFSMPFKEEVKDGLLVNLEPNWTDEDMDKFTEELNRYEQECKFMMNDL